MTPIPSTGALVVCQLLTPRGEAGAAAIREQVLSEIPDAVPKLIRPLLEAGLITGWRNVCSVHPPGELPGAICGPHRTGREFTQKEEEK